MKTRNKGMIPMEVKSSLKLSKLDGHLLESNYYIDYVFFTPPITEKVEDSTTISRDLDIDATTKDKFDKENKMVRGHMLSHMANNLFDLFVKNKLAKSIWIPWKRIIELMMLESRSMPLENESDFR
ncbi:hypothetical protein J1N35_018448 [Gossypium stocksii]|uniref:Uncharacterized protein n=1 Tax=Gossypium stocksii TaxID=47602 RepID=A0A9D3VP12_9ROSI|nr:hypothetical protein J1N35_018448 [Gossypium stocksii]